MTAVIIPTATRDIILPSTYGLNPDTTPALLAKLRNMPADLRDQILANKGTK